MTSSVKDEGLWSRSKSETALVTGEQQMPFDDQYPSLAMMPELRHFNIPSHIEVDFDETFKMPRVVQTSTIGKHAGRLVVGKFFTGVYKWSLDITFYFLSFLFGIFITLGWGIAFGALTFTLVWLVQPAWKLTQVFIYTTGHMYVAFIRTFMDPFFQSIGLSYSYCRLRFNVIGRSSLKVKDYVDL